MLTAARPSVMSRAATSRSQSIRCITPARPAVVRRGAAHRLPGPRPAQVSSTRLCAKPDGVTGIVIQANKVLDNVAGLVPASVPRSAAKLGVTVAAGLFLWGLLQQVLSGVVTLAVIGGLGYYFVTRGGGGGDGGGGGGTTSAPRDEYDDPLSEARRIMDKYKK